tara:strand:+ start:476 stop:952 length:477 start_codon:yes stop_codon:yes gene_type:complete
MASWVTLLYLTVLGHYRYRKGLVEDKWVINNRDGQTHTLGRERVFTPNKPVLIDSLSELIAARAPTPPLRSQERMVVVEDSAVLPLLPEGEPLPATILAEVDVATDTSAKLTYLETAKDAAHSDTLRMVFLILASAAALGFLFLSVLVAQVVIWGNPE